MNKSLLNVEAPAIDNCNEILTIFKKHGLYPKSKLISIIKCPTPCNCYYTNKCQFEVDSNDISDNLKNEIISLYNFTRVTSSS